MAYTLNWERYRCSDSGVPILKSEDIDGIANAILSKFNIAALTIPQSIDIDALAEQVMKLKLDFHYLSNNGVILGLTSFKNQQITVYNKEKNKVQNINIEKHTVVIDQSLIESASQEQRYRFTLGHEVGHVVCHQKYYTKSNEQKICNRGYSERRLLKNDIDWLEWQADRFAAAILMPNQAVKNLIKSIVLNSYERRYEEYVYQVSKTFNVSWQAAEIRLKNLNIIDKNASIWNKRIYTNYVCTLNSYYIS